MPTRQVRKDLKLKTQANLDSAFESTKLLSRTMKVLKQGVAPKPARSETASDCEPAAETSRLVNKVRAQAVEHRSHASLTLFPRFAN